MKIVLQARTSSSRLPAKVLLPLGGRPLAILCAQRLCNRGAELVLATSADASDDELAAQARDHGISVFRGSLDHVARRYLECATDLADHEVIVRATADNPVPDGDLIVEMLGDLEAAGTPYLGTGSYSDIPYGLGVELFRAGEFRRSFSEAMSPAMAEHVTTPLLRLGPQTHPGQSRFSLGSDLRLSVDTLDDYLVAARAIRRADNPIAASWRTLAEAFRNVRGLGG